MLRICFTIGSFKLPFILCQGLEPCNITASSTLHFQGSPLSIEYLKSWAKSKLIEERHDQHQIGFSLIIPPNTKPWGNKLDGLKLSYSDW